MMRTAQLRTQTLELVGALDPDRLSGADAAAVVQDLAVIEKAAATGRMFAALRVAKTDAWRGQGHASAVDWLAAQAGITVREAGTQLSTAKKADRLDKTKAQMHAGKLSPSQAGAVADAATADPAAEDDLLDTAANDTTAKLKDQAARTKAAATDSATRERRIHAERSARYRTDADGAFCLHLRGPAIDGIHLQALLRPFEEQAFRTGRHDGIRDTFENRTYDAFQTLVNQLRMGAAPSQPTAAPAVATKPGPAASQDAAQAAPGRPAPPPEPIDTYQHAADARHTTDESHHHQASGPASGAPRPPGGNNVKVIVRIDHTALIRGHTIAGETCDVAGLGPISVTTVNELLRDDPFLAAVVTKGRDVVTVAHLGRGLNAHQRTALEALGLRCSNRACNRTVALQIDHRVPYAQNPETKLDNQDPLCPDCHRRKTHHGWHLEPGTGPRRFLSPDQPTGRMRDQSASAAVGPARATGTEHRVEPTRREPGGGRSEPPSTPQPTLR